MGVASAYGCECEGEEYSRKSHDRVESLSPLTFLPLNVAGTDEETKKDTYSTGSPSAQNHLDSWGIKSGAHHTICTARRLRGRMPTHNSLPTFKTSQRTESVAEVWIEEKRAKGNGETEAGERGFLSNRRLL